MRPAGVLNALRDENCHEVARPVVPATFSVPVVTGSGSRSGWCAARWRMLTLPQPRYRAGLVGQHKDIWLADLREALLKVEQVRGEAKAVVAIAPHPAGHVDW